jgi:hypothetical protein
MGQGTVPHGRGRCATPGLHVERTMPVFVMSG